MCSIDRWRRNDMHSITLSRRGIMGALIASGAVGTLDLGFPQIARAQNSRALGGSRIDAALNAAISRYRSLNEGKNADYIPALAQVPSKFFGMAVVGPDGRIHQAGDSSE